MAKIGVGVGDEFPIDDGKPEEDVTKERPAEGKPEGEREQSRENQSCGGGPRCSGDDWRAYQGDWQRYWREHHHKWHGRSSFTGGHTPNARHFLAPLFIIGGIALLIAIISHFFYFILGAAVIAVLYAMHRGQHGAMWDMSPNPPASK